MRLSQIRYHWPRIRHELGKRLPLGKRQFRVRGYIPNRLTTTFSHEKHLLVPLRRAMDMKAGTIIDIGVNTGQTLLKVLEIDSARPYVGFEPQVACCFFVDQFLRDNDVASARVFCLALSDENRLLPFFSENPFDESATLAPPSTENVTHHFNVNFVPARIGDEVLHEMDIASPAIIKVDVEGAEISVFAGLRQTIERARPICFFEVLPNFTGYDRVMVAADEAITRRATAGKLWDFFKKLDYRICQIRSDGSEVLIAQFDLDHPDAFQGADFVAHP